VPDPSLLAVDTRLGPVHLWAVAKIRDIVRHPLVYGERARHHWRMFRWGLRATWLHAPPWMAHVNRRREVLDYGPPNIFLETASPCNLRCPMCPTGAKMVTRRGGFMHPDLARKFVEEIRHRPEQVGLWLAGEPLLSPHLVEIVRIMATKDLPTRIHTNATRLTRERSRALIEAGLRWISFSLDGVTREQHERMRAGSDYDQTLANIREFLRVKREIGAGTPHVVIQNLVPWRDGMDPGDKPETPDSVRALFDGLGEIEFESHLAHSWSGQMNGDGLGAPNRSGVGLRRPCYVPWHSLTIAWNGDAVSCLGDLNGTNVLGNLYRENLYDLWNNARHRHVRRVMHTRDALDRPLCGGCDRLWIAPKWNDYRMRLLMLRYWLRF
jgi:MoaA/NifB/PqqE/SkfB family radical SAM enzyme